ncbi:MAG: nuclear transport factor 2 family protein [bacterium]
MSGSTFVPIVSSHGAARNRSRHSLSLLRDDRLLVLVALLFVFAVPARAQVSVEKTLFRLEDEFAQAVVKRDAKALRQIVAPKWVYSDESGVMEREAGIKAFTSGTDTVQHASNANMRALVYPNSAVVIGILEMKGRGPEGPFTHRYRYTDAWVLLDGRWQCVASQDYLIPNAK